MTVTRQGLKRIDREMEGYRKFVVYTPFVFPSGIEVSPWHIENFLTGSGLPQKHFMPGTVHVEVE